MIILMVEAFEDKYFLLLKQKQLQLYWMTLSMRGSTSDVRIWRLTYKVDPHTEKNENL